MRLTSQGMSGFVGQRHRGYRRGRLRRMREFRHGPCSASGDAIASVSSTAAPAYLRNVLLNPVRARRSAQRPALVARLTPRLAPRPASKALRAALRRRLLQPVARRRLAAVGAGQTETALQLPYPVTKPRVLQLKTRNLLTGALRPRNSQRVKRFRTTHPKVDSFFDSNVNPSWAVTFRHAMS